VSREKAILKTGIPLGGHIFVSFKVGMYYITPCEKVWPMNREGAKNLGCAIAVDSAFVVWLILNFNLPVFTVALIGARLSNYSALKFIRSSSLLSALVCKSLSAACTNAYLQSSN